MNKNKLINYLKDKKIYVISPHFDDAILSMGMLLYELKEFQTANIINVFTKAHTGPYTLSARRYLTIAGYSDAVKLYKERESEDKKAMDLINAKCLNLGLMDVLFRRKSNRSFFRKYFAEFDHIYPTYRWHALKRINLNDPAINDLKIQLKKVVPDDAVVFAPFGIGNHTDHCLTRDICSSLFKNVIYYVDFPYNLRLNNSGKAPNNYEKFDLDIDLETKSKLAHVYKSQINGLFPGGIVPEHQERFFLPKGVIC